MREKEELFFLIQELSLNTISSNKLGWAEENKCGIKKLKKKYKSKRNEVKASLREIMVMINIQAKL